MPCNLLVVAEYGILNGGERSLLAVLPRLKQLGFQFSALLPIESEFSTALAALEIPTHALVKNSPAGQRLDRQQILGQLESRFQSLQPDLIHCNSLAVSRWCGPIAKKMNIPSLGYLRDIIRLSRRAIEDINALDRIVAVSNATRDWHVNAGMDAAKVQVVYNGVDLEVFQPLSCAGVVQLRPDVRAEIGIPTASPLLLFVGQIGVRKGVDLLLSAFEIVAAKHSDCHLLIVGERNSKKDEAVQFESDLRCASRQSRFNQRIHWLGRRRDVEHLMRQATVLLHPARQEPLGRVLLEAAASGLPMVTSDVGGSAEILTGMEFFDLLQPLDANRIANRTVELLSDSQQRELISRNLRKRTESCFSNEQCANALSAIYRDLLIDPAGRSRMPS